MLQSTKSAASVSDQMASADSTGSVPIRPSNSIVEPLNQRSSEERGADRFMMILRELHEVVDLVAAVQNSVRNLTHQVGSLSGQAATLHIDMGGLRSDMAHLTERLNDLNDNR
jgi:hypothetical protein